MMKRTTIFAILLALICLNGTATPPPIADSLYIVDDRGGTVFQFDDFDLTKPGANWSLNGSTSWQYGEVEGKGYYQMKKESDIYAMSRSSGSFEVDPNRNYIVSALLYCGFERGEGREIVIGLRNTSAAGSSLYYNLTGVPADQNEWIRWEYECTGYTLAKYIMFYLRHFKFSQGLIEFYIADLDIVELPAKELPVYAPGEGVEFPGSAGSLDMAVLSSADNGDSILVETTAGLFTFHKSHSTIKARQMIQRVRDVCEWESSVSFEGLQILKQDEKVCVLSNDQITIGVQMDNLVFITPHGGDVELTVESLFKGHWNRLKAGHLVSVDHYGGLNVNPDIPPGSARDARYTAVSGVNFNGVYNMLNYETRVEAGWKVKWTISPGERLAFGIMPSRPYDWEKSFNFNYRNVYYGQSTSVYNTYRNVDDINCCLLWNYTKRGWGGSSDYILEAIDSTDYSNHVKAIHNNNMSAINYMSSHFYHRQDANRYIEEVKRHRDTWGIDGVYTDGNPAQDWVSSYIISRRTRELFPDGEFVIHTTGKAWSGGPPLSVPDIFIPAIDAYATATLRGETMEGPDNKNWPYVEYVTNQYGKANCIGIQKPDKWNFESANRLSAFKVGLVYGGRGRGGAMDSDPWRNEYLPVYHALEANWRMYGEECDYFENYYVPRAKELVEEKYSPKFSPVYDTVDCIPDNTSRIILCDNQGGSKGLNIMRFNAQNNRGGNTAWAWFGGYEAEDMHLYVHFPGRTLSSEGEKIVLSVRYKAGKAEGGLDTSSVRPDVFRLGLFNNQGVEVDDLSGIAHEGFSGYSGYFGKFSVNPNIPPGISIRNTGNDTLILQKNVYLLGSGVQDGILLSNVPGILTFTVEKTAEGMELSFANRDGSGTFEFSSQDESATETHFNTLAIGIDDTPELLDYFQVDWITVSTIGLITSEPYLRLSKRTSPLRIYPNPAEDALNLQLAGFSGNIRIFDLMGRVVRSYEAESLGLNPGKSLFSLDISGLNPGMYILEAGRNRAQFIKR